MHMINFCYTPFRGVFGILTAAAWFAAALYARQFMKEDEHSKRYNFFNLITFGATMGVFFAADFFTLFVFFEIMSLASFMLVAHRNTKEAKYASGTYLGISIAGGMAILMGLFIIYSNSNNSANEGLFFAAAVCMFLGFGAKAGAFPLHVWLPASYTEAPAPATALLSAVLSKTGIFGLLLVTSDLLPMNARWGKLMIAVGIATMLLGGVRGVTSGNFKTTLAYSSMSQIGFMLAGVGMQPLAARFAFSGTEQAFDEKALEIYKMAVNGTFLHMINHSLVKLVLFMLAGIVFLNAGSYELNKARGFGRKKPFMLTMFLIAALGVCGIPLLNGYVSKTLLHESIAEYSKLLMEIAPDAVSEIALLKMAEYFFIFSGGLTVAYMIKLFVVLFVDKNEDPRIQSGYEGKKDYMAFSDMIAVLICAIPIPIIGIIPNITADKLADYGFMGNAASEIADYGFMDNAPGMMHDAVNYFSVKNLTGAAASAAVGVLVYVAIVRFLMLKIKDKRYREVFPSWLDMEKYVYMDVFYVFVPFVLGIVSRILDSAADMMVVIFRKTVFCDRHIPYELPEGNRMTHLIGKNMELAKKAYCAAQGKEYKPGDYEHKLALKNMDIFENLRIIERSLSFGLFMFCVGLLLIMIYLLAVN